MQTLSSGELQNMININKRLEIITFEGIKHLCIHPYPEIGLKVN